MGGKEGDKQRLYSQLGKEKFELGKGREGSRFSDWEGNNRANKTKGAYTRHSCQKGRYNINSVQPDPPQVLSAEAVRGVVGEIYM